MDNYRAWNLFFEHVFVKQNINVGYVYFDEMRIVLLSPVIH